MADFTTLKSQIAAVIKTNGAQSITGDLLQAKLFSIIDGLNAVKVDAETGKALSSNDLTDDLLSKLNSAIQQAGLDSAVAAAVAKCVLKADIVSATGTASDKVMSQKAVTELNAKNVLKTDIVSATGTATDKVMSQKTVTELHAKDVLKTDIVDTAGTATDKVLSQKAGSNILAQCVLKTDIVDKVGAATDKVLSQKAVTELLGEKNSVYGVEWYYNNASPTLTRIGNLDLHRTLPVQSAMRRCVLDDAGKVVYYLDASNSLYKEDGTLANLDGTDGQVMVEVPAFWMKAEDDTANSCYRVEISLNAFAGAIEHPRHYIGAMEAAIDRTNKKLASVRNLTEQYRGGGNNSAWDGTYRSLLGMPATSTSLTSFRTLAQARGAGWHLFDVAVWSEIFWLFAVEFGTLNCQLAFNSEVDANGYRQGGLGSGVTIMNYDKWNAYNGIHPFIKCGYTYSLGNTTGVVSFSWDAEQEAAYGAAMTCEVPSYRGIENPFGHIYKWTDGYLGVGDGTVQTAYVCREKEHYASVLNEYYQKVGTLPAIEGFIKSIVKNAHGDIVPTATGGSSTTYMCDYLWKANAENTTYGVFVGGNANFGTLAGLAFAHARHVPSSALAYVGSRLCWQKND